MTARTSAVIDSAYLALLIDYWVFLGTQTHLIHYSVKRALINAAVICKPIHPRRAREGIAYTSRYGRRLREF